MTPTPDLFFRPPTRDEPAVRDHADLFIGGALAAPPLGDEVIDVVLPRHRTAHRPGTQRRTGRHRRRRCGGPDGIRPRRVATAYRSSERIEVLGRLSAAIKARAAAVRRLITDEVGSPRRLGEVRAGRRRHRRARHLRQRSLPTIPGSQTRPGAMGGQRAGPPGSGRRGRRPIVPWNAPLFVAALKLAPALAAGCTVVLKPSPGCAAAHLPAGRGGAGSRPAARRAEHRPGLARRPASTWSATPVSTRSASPVRPRSDGTSPRSAATTCGAAPSNSAASRRHSSWTTSTSGPADHRWPGHRRDGQQRRGLHVADPHSRAPRPLRRRGRRPHGRRRAARRRRSGRPRNTGRSADQRTRTGTGCSAYLGRRSQRRRQGHHRRRPSGGHGPGLVRRPDRPRRGRQRHAGRPRGTVRAGRGRDPLRRRRRRGRDRQRLRLRPGRQRVVGRPRPRRSRRRHGCAPARSRSTPSAPMDFGSPFGGFKSSGIGREGGPEAFASYTEYQSIVLPPGRTGQSGHGPGTSRPPPDQRGERGDEGRGPVGAQRTLVDRDRSSSTRPSTTRCWSSCTPRACATPTTTSSPVTCRSGCPASAATKAPASCSRSARGVTSARAGRPRGVQLHAVVRPLPVLRDRAPEPLRPRREALQGPADLRRHRPPPRPGRGPRHRLRDRLLRPPHRGERGQRA